MTFDPFRPQPFNVAIGSAEAADALPQHPLIAPAIPYVIPAAAGIEPDASDIYPAQQHGVLPGVTEG